MRDKFPRVWRVASVYLAMPATNASSERVFSTTNVIVKRQRWRMDWYSRSIIHVGGHSLGGAMFVKAMSPTRRQASNVTQTKLTKTITRPGRFEVKSEVEIQKK